MTGSSNNSACASAALIADTALPDLRDHLAAAHLAGLPIKLSPEAAGALHMAMTTGAPEYSEDPVDIIRTLLCTVDHYWSLPDDKREMYPSPTSELSPLMQAARRACIERGFTAGGLAIEPEAVGEA